MQDWVTMKKESVSFVILGYFFNYNPVADMRCNLRNDILKIVSICMHAAAVENKIGINARYKMLWRDTEGSSI